MPSVRHIAMRVNHMVSHKRCVKDGAARRSKSRATTSYETNRGQRDANNTVHVLVTMQVQRNILAYPSLKNRSSAVPSPHTQAVPAVPVGTNPAPRNMKSYMDLFQIWTQAVGVIRYTAIPAW